MSKLTQLKLGAALVVMMLALTVLRTERDAFVYLVVGVGALNALAPLTGTAWIRGVAVAATFVALIWPATVGAVAMLDWVAWAPAFAIAAIAASTNARRGDTTTAAGAATAARTTAQVTVAAVIIAVAVAVLVYRWLWLHQLQQTAALFIGIPTLLALAVVFLTSPRSALGVAFKAVTLGLLVSGLFLNEGVLCIVMAAPLFYAVAGLIGAAVDEQRRMTGRPRWFGGLLMLAIAPMSLEGVTTLTTVNRRESVTESRVVQAPPDAVARALVSPPRFDRERPAYLRSGFPSAMATRIDSGGARWVIQMRGGEMRWNGMEPRTGDLVLALEESHTGLLRWRVVSDDSHMTHFLNWRESLVRWEAIDARTTKVTWTLTYDRGLDPAWYFGPMERYAMHLAAGYLIESVATP